MKTAATVAGVGIAAVAVVWIVLHSTLAITVTVLSLLLAMALNRAVEKLEQWKLGRRAAVAVTMGLFIAGLIGLGVVIVPMVVEQVSQLVERGPELWAKVKGSRTYVWANQNFDLEQRFSAAQAQQDDKSVTEAAQPLLKAVGGMFAGIGGFVTILFLVTFMLLYGGKLVRGALAETLPAHRERYEKVFSKVYRSIGGYLSGLLLIALLNATVTSIFLAVLGVPFWLPLGILSGLGSFLPLVGVTISGLLIVGVAALAGGPWAAVASVAYITLYQQVENHLIAPLIYERTIRVNPLVTLLGILFFAELVGVVGALLAVPLIAALQIVLRELFLLRRERLGLPLRGEIAAELEKRRPPFWRRTREA